MPFPPRSWLNWDPPTDAMACTWRQALAGSLKKNKEPYDKWRVTILPQALESFESSLSLLNKPMQNSRLRYVDLQDLRTCRYQLATVRADGRPANRTVVHRGFMDETDRLLSISDIRHAAPERWQLSCMSCKR